jgi:translation initiation factor 1 (eIF-1/SUI1)
MINFQGKDFAVVGLNKKQGDNSYLDNTLADQVKTGTAVNDNGVQIGAGSLFKHSIEFIKRKFPEAINIMS